MSGEADEKRITLQIERSAGFALVHCHGQLVAGVTDIFHGQVRQLIPEFKRIILDFKELSYIDSSGLGALLRLYVTAKSQGCSLELLNIGPRVRQVLGITNLISVLKIVGENNIRFP